MASKLIIIESPGKIKTLSGFLGKDYKIVASMGHIEVFKDTGKFNLGINVDGDFERSMQIESKKKDVVKKIKEAAKDAKEIYICADPDREGEAIASSVYGILPKTGKKIYRATFNEITKKAVQEALNNPKEIDWNLVKSAEVRSIVDRIIGYRLSAVVRNKVSAKSAGRVQSAALRIISEREKEIVNFVPVTYFELFLPFKKSRKKYKAQYRGTDSKRITKLDTQKQVDTVLADLRKTDKYTVKDIKVSDRKVKPKPPYTTSSFQQDMSAKLGMSPKKSMMQAQSLYEGVSYNGNHTALITYMRTDSTRLSDDFVKSASELIQKEYGKDYLEKSKAKAGSGSQDAHEGIRPTDINLKPENLRSVLSVDEFKVYDLVWKRAVSSLMSEAIIEDTRVVINSGKHNFEISGNKTKFPGFRSIYIDYEDEEDSKDNELPEFKLAEVIVKDGDIIVDKKQTNPPNRYTEASLIKEMEKLGIGRPSTYASVMETLKNRGYSETKKRTMYPTEEGVKLSDFLSEYFGNMISTTYTAEMEKMLDDIAGGDIDHLKELKTFYSELVDLIKNVDSTFVKEAPKETDHKCDKCGAPMVIRKGRNGEFLACSRYPACKNTKSLTDTADLHTCDVCNKGKIVQRVAKKKGTKFYACNNFPACKTTYSIEEYKIKYENAE